MIVKMQLTHSEGLPVGVLFHNKQHTLVQKFTSIDMVASSISLLGDSSYVFMIGSLIKGAFQPQAIITNQNW